MMPYEVPRVEGEVERDGDPVALSTDGPVQHWNDYWLVKVQERQDIGKLKHMKIEDHRSRFEALRKTTLLPVE